MAIRGLTRRWKRIFKEDAGFTLVEVLVAAAVATIVSSLLGGAIFQALSIQRSWEDNVLATKDLRHAASWFARDALNATETDLVNGAPPAGSVTLTWPIGEDLTRTSAYELSGTDLVRSLDGTPNIVARNVSSAEFSLDGKVLTAQLEVQRGGVTESISLRTYLRMLK